MKNVLALIYSSEYDERNYDSLCKVRPDYMLPFGGRYRVIDFVLSNLTNYNVTSAILYGDRNLRSTLDHVGNGKIWELNRKRGGLMINPPNITKGKIPNEIENFYSTMDHFKKNKREYVYITNPMYITKVNIADAYEKMVENDSDVMIFSKKTKDEMGFYLNSRIINLGEDGRPVSCGFNLGLSDTIELFSGSIMMKKDVFMNIIMYTLEKNSADTLIDAIFDYPYELSIDLYRNERPLRVIKDTLSFYNANMELLDRDYYNQLFFNDGLVYTKSKDEPSAEYRGKCEVKNSLVSNGCIIEGSVENSVISRGVTIEEGAIVKNCLLFQDTVIKAGSILNNVITDKDTVVEEHVRLFGNRINPYLTNKTEIIR